MCPLPSILMIEDDEVEAEALARAFTKYQLPYPLYIASDGLMALHMLRGEAGYSALPWPHLILLDLNLPRLSGLDFLRIVRQDRILQPSLVCVLTTSDAKRDQQAAFRYNVAAYFIKEKMSPDLLTLLTFLQHYCSLTQFPEFSGEGSS